MTMFILGFLSFMNVALITGFVVSCFLSQGYAAAGLFFFEVCVGMITISIFLTLLASSEL